MQISTYEKERLDLIKKIGGQISPDKISDLSSAAGYFDCMVLDRKMMLHYFERFTKLQQAAKKDEAWQNTARYADKLRGLASQLLFMASKD